MKHRIEISSVAEAEADSVFLRLSQISRKGKPTVRILHIRHVSQQTIGEDPEKIGSPKWFFLCLPKLSLDTLLATLRF